MCHLCIFPFYFEEKYPNKEISDLRGLPGYYSVLYLFMYHLCLPTIRSLVLWNVSPYLDPMILREAASPRSLCTTWSQRLAAVPQSAMTSPWP